MTTVRVSGVHPVLDDIAESVTDRYNKMLEGLSARLLSRRSRTLSKSIIPLVISSDLLKAVNNSGQERAKPGEADNRKYERPKEGVVNPGARGGKFYRTKTGKIRYGTPKEESDRDATPQEVAHHFAHYRPTPLAGGAQHKKLLKVLLKTNKFDEDDVAFLSWWENALDAFKDSAGLTDEDLEGDLSDLVLDVDGKDMSYTEAVHDFLMAQDWGDQTPDEVSAAIDKLVSDYKQALSDPSVASLVAAQTEALERSVHGWFVDQSAKSDTYEKTVGAKLLGNTGDWHEAMAMCIGEGGLGLIFKPTAKQKAGAFRGVIAPNAGWLDEYLPGHTELDRLSSTQLAAVYVAERLNQAWEPESKTFDYGNAEPGSKSKLARQCLDLATKRLFGDNKALSDNFKAKLEECAEKLATKFSDANTGKDGSGFAKDLISTKVSGEDADKEIKRLAEKAAQFQKIKGAALAAQDDVSWSVPPTMKDGFWGGSKINPVTGKPFEPFLHQKKSVNWMCTVKRGLLALDAGMGKTGTVIACAERLKKEGKIKRAILFLPPSLMSQWPGEIASFAPDAAKPGKILNLAGLSMEERRIALESPMAKNAEYILLSTGTLNSKGSEGEGEEEGSDDVMVDLLSKLDGAVFIDEVHQGGYKTATGIRHQIASKVIGDRDYAFGLTATPMPNSPLDTFNLTNLFAPGSVGTEDEWRGKMHGIIFDNDAQQWVVGNPENIVEMNQRLKPFCFYKGILDDDVVADMGKQMAPLNSNSVDLDASTTKCKVTGLSQLDYFKTVIPALAEAQLQKITAKRDKEGKDPLNNEGLVRAALTRGMSRLAAISPALIDKRYTGPSPKLDAMVSRIVDHFKGDKGTQDKPVVVFSSFPKKAFPLLKQQLMNAGIDPSGIGVISGEKNAQERAFLQDMTNGYTNDKGEFVPGRVKILCVGTLSGGAGLNLQKKAAYSMFLDEPWNPAAKRQALGRVWRPGRKDKNPVTADTFRIVGAEDTNIEKKLATKQTMASALLGKPNPDAFADAAASDISKLTGHLAPTELTPEDVAKQLDYIHASSGHVDISEFFGEDFEGGFTEDDVGAGLSQIKKYTREQMTEKQQKQKVLLGKVAPNLVSEVDMGVEQDKWSEMMARKNAQQQYEVKMLCAKAHEQAGNTEKQKAALAAADRIKAAYPEVFGTKEAEKEPSGKTAKVVMSADHAKEASRLNGYNTNLKNSSKLTYGAASYITKNSSVFSEAERKAAKKVIAAMTAAAGKVTQGTWMDNWRIGDPISRNVPTAKVKKETKPEKTETKPKSSSTKPEKTEIKSVRLKENPHDKKEDAISWSAHRFLEKRGELTTPDMIKEALRDYVVKNNGKYFELNTQDKKTVSKMVDALYAHLRTTSFQKSERVVIPLTVL